MLTEELCRRVAAYGRAHNAGTEPLPTAIDGLSVALHTAPTALAPVLYRPIFCLVLQGAKQAFFADRAVTFGRMESLIVSFDLPTVSRVVRASATEPYVALALQLDRGLLHDLMGEVATAQIDAARGDSIAAGAADAAIVDAMGRLFGLLDQPAAAPVLEPLVKREIHYWLLAAHHGAMLRQLSKADSHASRISRAIAVIRRDFDRSLRVADLAEVAHMSPSAFHDHFKAHTGTTPLQFQKQLRLIEARRLIQAGTHSVSRAAFDVGYESPTQFSREYARLFGTPPSSDAPARLRQAG